MQASLVNYCDRSFRSFAINIEMVQVDCTMDNVHNLRLNIKRLRVLFDLLAKYDRSLKKIKIFNEIDRIFKYSGQLRDVQVETLILRSYKSRDESGVKDFAAILSYQKIESKRKLLNVLNKLNPFDLILLNQKLDDIIEILSSNSIQLKYNKHIQKLNLLLAKISKDKVDVNLLHSIRILIKEIIYTNALLKKCRLEQVNNPNFIIKLNQIQQNMGVWHDLVVLQKKIINLNSKKGLFELLMGINNQELTIIEKEIIGEDMPFLTKELIAQKKGA